MKEYWSSLAAALGVLALCQSLLRAVFPPELQFAVAKGLSRVSNWFSSYCYFDITEIDGVNTNELYNGVQLYLSGTASATLGSNRLSLSRGVNSSGITFGLSNNDSIGDTFRGASVVWEHSVTQRQSQSFSWRPLPEEKRGFCLRMRKRDKEALLHPYLDFIMAKAAEIRQRSQERLLYTNSRGGSMDSRGNPWESVPFKHPSTFRTLAMDPVLKSLIMDDLLDFASAQSFYQATGKAWKRGYLLYGPPGTGKSSMIAAMANLLAYDIYDLELSEVNTNSDLRKLLMKTTSKSIIVIEDIDCSINLTTNNIASRREHQQHQHHLPLPQEGNNHNNNSITLSGLLNFTDGLWSCCGSEKIFVFTTNHIHKMDPALLRSGRMDMHIFMTYCSFPALKILLTNYLGIDLQDEKIALQLEEVIDKAEMTPADISELLIKNRRNKDKALTELLEALKAKAEKLTKEKKNSHQEDQEQEKRALDTPNKGQDLSHSHCSQDEKIE